LAGFAPSPFAHFQTNLFHSARGEAAVDAIIAAIDDAPAQFRVLVVPLYGAISQVSVNDMAFALR
jgi:hypothetical protein